MLLSSRLAILPLLGILAALSILASACSGPGEDLCRAACENVARVTAEAMPQATPAKVEEVMTKARAELTGCVSTCRSGDKDHAACLAGAKSLKQVNECAALK